MSDEAAKVLAQEIVAKLADAAIDALGGSGSFWDIVRQAVAEHLTSTEQEEAQIWLNYIGDKEELLGQDVVCVTMYGADEPFLLPFMIPPVDIPYSPHFADQIQGAMNQIADLRRFAAHINALADEGQAGLDAVLARKL